MIILVIIVIKILWLEREINKEVLIVVDNYIRIMIVWVCLGVISFWYFKCNEMVRSLLRVIVVMVRKDVFVSKIVINICIVNIVGYKNWLFIIFNCSVMIMLYIGCRSILMVRLEMVRFKSSFFRVEGIDEVFYMVWIIRRLLKIVMGENVK